MSSEHAEGGQETETPKGARRRKEPLPLTDDRLWTIDDVCRFSGFGRTRVYGWVAEGSLPTIRPPGTPAVRFDPKEVREWFRARR